mmetsp:Transcript_61130/g.196941  ORF Transcript_61130/g.196941 Transcript_61130/m.196941 type:complete len:263 (+) Transcript_61130:712-1500(+)
MNLKKYDLSSFGFDGHAFCQTESRMALISRDSRPRCSRSRSKTFSSSAWRSVMRLVASAISSMRVRRCSSRRRPKSLTSLPIRAWMSASFAQRFRRSASSSLATPSTPKALTACKERPEAWALCSLPAEPTSMAWQSANRLCKISSAERNSATSPDRASRSSRSERTASRRSVAACSMQTRCCAVRCDCSSSLRALTCSARASDCATLWPRSSARTCRRPACQPGSAAVAGGRGAGPAATGAGAIGPRADTASPRELRGEPP